MRKKARARSTRSALMRSDDGGENWEYYSTLAYDPASIIDYEEPALLRLKDGRLVCFLRTHVNPSGDAKNMVMVVSEDDGLHLDRRRNGSTSGAIRPRPSR